MSINKTKPPHFIIKDKFQKGGNRYSNFLTTDILQDITEKILGQTTFTYQFLEEVNVGKLAMLDFNGSISYIMFPDLVITSRNSYFQSFPSSLVRYYSDPNPNKEIFFYFLDSQGNNSSPYFQFMYRLMATAGVQFLNVDPNLPYSIAPFQTLEDIIAAREVNRQRNRSNNSTYITKSSDHIIEVFGKTYGANKKETTLLCLALSNLLEENNSAKLYIICENDLTNLPAPDVSVIEALGKIEIIPTDLTMEKRELESNNSLRSPLYLYNLLDKLGPKKCAFCNCDIPELIQGAHIWAVADIKKEHQLTLVEKLNHATNGDNGLWLCENHHKLFDRHLLTIDLSGDIYYSDKIAESSAEYLTGITTISSVQSDFNNANFKFYLNKRYNN